MTRPLNVLMIAPYAPPTNAAEAIQVRRLLTALDNLVTGQLVTVTPDGSGSWTPPDSSLELALKHFEVMRLALPLHSFTNRIFSSHRLKRFHTPDAMCWIRWMKGRILRTLARKPDILYSRSYPLSAALLARDLKQALGIPWIMHLSDPWVDNPYATGRRDPNDEQACFAMADRITLTTEGQAAFYRRKYPEHAAKIHVSPNMLPEPSPPTQPMQDDRLHLVFAGNLYGDRSPEPLIAAIEGLPPELRHHLQVDIYGHAQADALAAMKRLPGIVMYHGPVLFQKAYKAQQHADILLSIEPKMDHPLAAHFLPSKALEAIALGKPLLALTPEGSETEALCKQGYGWAIDPSRPEILRERLAQCITERHVLRNSAMKAPPERYQTTQVAKELLAHMDHLCRGKA